MGSVLLGILGVVVVTTAVVDMINTLVSTRRTRSLWWPSRRLALGAWRLVRSLAVRLPAGPRNAVMTVFAPLIVLLLLVAWVTAQIVGFGLIWFAIARGQADAISGVDSFLDAIYFSGVVFFTVGFGEVVPASSVPRFGALLEAFNGVLTTALVIGYLPALYGAYSERERKLMTLDDGTDERITPTNLVKAWSPDGDPQELLAHFEEWEHWVAGIIETNASFPMLSLFRSHHDGQNWVTAAGLLADAALHCEIIEGADQRAPYFLIRRVARMFDELTEGVNLSGYQSPQSPNDIPQVFVDLHRDLAEHGFPVLSLDEAYARSGHLRETYAPQLEHLIDLLLAPRGFWAQGAPHSVVILDEATDQYNF